jgi:hypothetical protein
MEVFFERSFCQQNVGKFIFDVKDFHCKNVSVHQNKYKKDESIHYITKIAIHRRREMIKLLVSTDEKGAPGRLS